VSAILKAMHAVMSEVGAIEKGRTNTGQNYKFRGVDDVLKVLQPLFIKHKILCTQEVLESSYATLQSAKGGTLIYARMRVKHTYRSVEDESCIECVTAGEAMDSGDKASNKAMATALKYAHFYSFTIPTEEPIDSENESPELAPEVVPETRSRREVMATAKPAQRTAASRPTVPPPTPGARNLPTVFPNYGRSKGAPIAGASSQDLTFYRAGAMTTLSDASKARFHERERALLEAIDLETSKQSDGPPPHDDNDGPPF
jgi:hypothetical protein